MKGYVTGFTGSGDIELKANNVLYAQNNFWTLKNDEGLIKFNIIQSRSMDANLTGTGKTDIGEIKIIYRDNSPDIGARFTFHNYSGRWDVISHPYDTWVGFPEIPESFYDFPDVGYIFTSFDFPTKNNFNISLYKTLFSGEYSVDLSSIPFN